MKLIKTLPEPNKIAKQHSKQLSLKIQKQLKKQGRLSFSKFMSMVLYTPNLGYYANGLPKIGEKGDFITAPEVSSIFSSCLARQAKQVLETLDSPNIIEFGAGLGTMAKDILLELQDKINIENYFIIELSSELKTKQQDTLKQSLPSETFAKIIWLDQLPKNPIEAVVLANEVLDAMPVERIRLENDHSLVAEVVFNEKSQTFNWDYQRINDKKLQYFADQLVNAIGMPAKGCYETEINLNIQPWLNSISDCLSKGLVLLIDYGYTRQEYYQPARTMGTLRCHYQHLAHDNPFFYPGLQDITAHIDFTEVAESGFSAGFKIAGFTTQAHFLMGSGLLEMSANIEDNVSKQLKIAQEIKTLTMPNEMGETFKVIALTKDYDKTLIGFSTRDLRHTL